MCKSFNLLLVFICTCFLFVVNVNAECSYNERKELLSAAKKVDISVEPVDNGDSNYSFKFSVTGLTDNIFVKYYNTNNGEEEYIFEDDVTNGMYEFVDDEAYMIYSYNFIFYSENENCTGYEITSKRIKKPMYNIYSENPNCSYENNSKFKYCQRFTETDYKLTTEKFLKALVDYNNKKSSSEILETQNNNSFISFIKKYIIVIVVSILLVAGIVVITILIKRKRSML